MKSLLVLLILIGCSKAPISSKETNNKNIKVELLFTHNGCNIYRFTDERHVYFSDCSQNFKTSHSESCGKNCTRTVDRQTIGL